jgi:hypothetical protein
MTSRMRAPLSASPRLFAAIVVLYGTAIGLILLLLEASTWLYFVAPFMGLPLLFWELHARSHALSKQGESLRAGPAGGMTSGQTEFFRYALRTSLGRSDWWLPLAWGATGIAVSGLGVALTSSLRAGFWLLPAVATLVAGVAFLFHWGARKSSFSLYLQILEELVDDQETRRGDVGREQYRGSVRIVSPVESGWVIQRPHAEKVGRLFDSESEALNAARHYLSQEGGGQLIIHGRDGRIRDLDTIAPEEHESASA